MMEHGKRRKEKGARGPKSVLKCLAVIFLSLFNLNLSSPGLTIYSASDWIGKQAPGIAPGQWINSQPLTLTDLRGKVVLLEFWTYGCYNCRNTLPHIKAWYKAFSSEKFEIIGIHTPEFEAEKDLDRVKRKVRELGIEYPVVTDTQYKTWDAYKQHYWPAMYLLDKQGVIRLAHIGEGAYEETEKKIRELLSK
jgi:thiol-disulfide isomerase/thioredoxin